MSKNRYKKNTQPIIKNLATCKTGILKSDSDFVKNNNAVKCNNDDKS